MKYPKIQTLFNRDTETFKVIEGDFRLKEFENIKQWYITEKIDGTNIRVTYPKLGQSYEGQPIAHEVYFAGRTDKAQIYLKLLEYLKETFTIDKLHEVFPDEDGVPYPKVILYGEGYGGRIQKAGKQYREDVAFRLFDVWVENPEAKMRGWWLEHSDRVNVAHRLGIEVAPFISSMTTGELVEYVKDRHYSFVAEEDGGNAEFLLEGVVGRTAPLMFTRKGQRVMCKLKVKDFPQEEAR